MQAAIDTRVFLESDYDAVVELWRASDGVEIAEGDDRASIARYLERNPNLSRVAECDGRIVGAVLCGHDGRRGLIYHLAVAADFRGRGLGRRLTAECLAALKTAGVPRALILVARDNAAGRAFWSAQGFEEISGALPHGVDLV